MKSGVDIRFIGLLVLSTGFTLVDASMLIVPQAQKLEFKKKHQQNEIISEKPAERILIFWKHWI